LPNGRSRVMRTCVAFAVSRPGTQTSAPTVSAGCPRAN